MSFDDTVEVGATTLADVVRNSWESPPTTPLDLEELEDLSLVTEIGRGGMGVVYRALQRSLNREVAVKLLDPRLTLSEKQPERFHQEVLLAASLNHPNIAHIHWVKRQNDLVYFVMELVDGPSLAEILTTRPPTTTDLIHVFGQVCDGLAHAHERGVVHRDLKPGNILVELASTAKTGDSATATDRDRSLGRAVLVDFGLAARHGESATTPDGMLMGTPAYMSPEQARGERIDHRSDLYSLGVTLFECLTGRVPFSAPTPMSMALKHICEPAPDPRELVPALHPDLASLTVQLLRKDPAERPQQGLEVKERLLAALDDGSLPRPSRPTSADVPGLARRQGTVMAVCLDGFLAAAHDQALVRTTFLLESWMDLVDRVIATHGGVIVRQEASLLVTLFGFPERASDHRERAVRALRDLNAAMRDLNRTHGRSQAFTAGLETGEVFVGQIGSRAMPICFGRPLDTAIELSSVRHLGVGLIGPTLSQDLADSIPLQPLIGVADDLGSASRVAPDYLR